MKKLLGLILVLSLGACSGGGSTSKLKERKSNDVELSGDYEIFRCNGSESVELANGQKGDATFNVMGFGDSTKSVSSVRYSLEFPLEEDDVELMEKTSSSIVDSLKKEHTDAIYLEGSGNAIFIYSDVKEEDPKAMIDDLIGRGYSCESTIK